AIQGEAPLESFLRWSDQPLVKLAESGLVFLLMVHMLGGLRLLVIENLDWRDEQKELATIAAGLSAVIAFILLARLFRGSHDPASDVGWCPPMSADVVIIQQPCGLV